MYEKIFREMISYKIKERKKERDGLHRPSENYSFSKAIQVFWGFELLDNDQLISNCISLSSEGSGRHSTSNSLAFLNFDNILSIKSVNSYVNTIPGLVEPEVAPVRS